MCEGCVADGSISAWLYEVIEAFLTVFPDEEFRSGHIVFADCNVDEDDILFCIEDAKAEEPSLGMLRWMLTVPDSSRR